MQLRKCGLHHWKERAKAVTVPEASSVSFSRKALIQISIQISIGLEKATTLPPARPNIVTRVSAYHSRECLFIPNLFTPATLLLGCFGLFREALLILIVGYLSACWISLCLLIVKVYGGRQIHERALFSYFLVWHASSSIVVLAE